jgi:hypothetical protein
MLFHILDFQKYNKQSLEYLKVGVREILEKQEAADRARQVLTQEQMAEYERTQSEFQLPMNSVEDIYHLEEQLGESSRRHRLVSSN